MRVFRIPRLFRSDHDAVAFVQEAGTDVPPVSVSAAYSAKATDRVVLANATGAAFNVTLPPADASKGQFLTVIRTNAGANAVGVVAGSGDTLSSAVSLSAQYKAVTLVNNGDTVWIVVAQT